jgi:DNA-binding response OmpR family regulator
MRILMIDDDHVFCGLIGDALEVSGHDVRRVPTTESGIGALLEHRYDVVLLDLDLGATRGESVIARMQRLGEHLPPIVILSGQPSGVLAAAAKATGAFAAVSKPCTIDELLAAINEAAGPTARASALPQSSA